MLDDALKTQLKAYLERLTRPVELVATLDDSQGGRDMRALLEQIAEQSDKISLRTDGSDARVPSFLITNPGVDSGLRFAGVPLGHEFTSLVLALLQVGGHPSKEPEQLQQQIRDISGRFHFETYYSITCHNCPDVIQALNLMAVLNPNITHTAIDGALYQQEIEDKQIMGVPTVFLNGQHFGQGRMALAEIVARIDDSAAEKAAQEISSKEPFDVLIVGGGPAGAAAGVYAARKGIRTGIAAQRFGGQVLDTMDIENYISVRKTEGPQFAAALEAHVRDYDVDIMNLQTASKLVPPSAPGGLIEVQFESGARLQAKTVILSTGARWRAMGVPGEEEYRTKGVTFCPHCDGPLFKGKRIAVIGGGNSGVEAAIDLAGIVEHVTLLEFAPQLRADDVLQKKLRSLPNVEVLLNAQTTQVQGQGGKVNALAYKNRETGAESTLALEGIFVQIGLLPNTDWLKGTLELSPMGEIVVDAHGRTSIPGVFAAGDCTTVPYKQIVIAAGDGAKAALSAFDHLIRS
ncbi:alkyl hydroperoxide reductase subunit F [Vandammella animalimorsus]|uniref:Alkyl hydroperoxide reductase subunit F n=1 Tax=Vandammella animalimorsus TaxID=2029117 RepID=A0A2A2T3K4_9BURK|nr:alkyl hydroperoxide reductase subunit F [Vandammella animalimorsus]PAX15771.1 alkyl hydroperoxide reductase subunit F [Vandammella animalimorsus]PAX19655.1 alkyl hydroperoxide reductase subunit F [Vandammella animalimorsus]